jgi:hypothetical protein
MINEKDFSSREIINNVRMMLKENSKINQASVDSFSRQIPSFYTSLCIKIYGKYDNTGPYFNKAMNLFRKITGDQALLEEIKVLILSESGSSCVEEEDFRFIELSKKPNDGLEKNANEVIWKLKILLSTSKFIIRLINTSESIYILND